MAENAEALDRNDRAHLEDALALLARHGHVPSAGEREVVLRLDEHGRIRWLEARRIRQPASELEQSSSSAA